MSFTQIPAHARLARFRKLNRGVMSVLRRADWDRSPQISSALSCSCNKDISILHVLAVRCRELFAWMLLEQGRPQRALCSKLGANPLPTHEAANKGTAFRTSTAALGQRHTTL